MTLKITAFSILTLSLKGLFEILSINNTVLSENMFSVAFYLLIG